MDDVTVVIPSYGGRSWYDRSFERARPSALAHDVPVVNVHGETLHGARNLGLELVETEYVCFLDADDELEPGFFTEIASADADIRVPAVRYMRNDVDQGVVMPRVAGHVHECADVCLADGNWIVVGAVARTELVRAVGGWRDFPMFEDYDLWLRCWQEGASIVPVPSAVYRAHVRADSRNRAPSQRLKRDAHKAICRANGLPLPAVLR